MAADVFAEETGPPPSGAIRSPARIQAPPVPVAASPDTAFRPNVNCTCRFRGQDFGIGESACIRGNLATCATFLNNTSWAISTAPCPMARNYSPVRASAGG
jgi:hypothetical protein